MKLYTRQEHDALIARYRMEPTPLICEECGRSVDRVMILEQQRAATGIVEGETVKICLGCARQAWIALSLADVPDDPPPTKPTTPARRTATDE